MRPLEPLALTLTSGKTGAGSWRRLCSGFSRPRPACDQRRDEDQPRLPGPKPLFAFTPGLRMEPALGARAAADASTRQLSPSPASTSQVRALHGPGHAGEPLTRQGRRWPKSRFPRGKCGRSASPPQEATPHASPEPHPQSQALRTQNKESKPPAPLAGTPHPRPLWQTWTSDQALETPDQVAGHRSTCTPGPAGPAQPRPCPPLRLQPAESKRRGGAGGAPGARSAGGSPLRRGRAARPVPGPARCPCPSPPGAVGKSFIGGTRASPAAIPASRRALRPGAGGAATP
ncbi:PREDICTED: vegetative cell wall protein gp1-like [Chinchilla lanigera]|uniref:vegetative cell wall protein gp1-like n=1 Tax=Chinchilla lanigera TaxID=34839 RepID=UPI000698221F|nr:PREDICTED: vegetative cell wall protein gp1-like [Chinchilla lanigera]